MLVTKTKRPTLRNFRASRSGDNLILCSSWDARAADFEAPKLWLGRSGIYCVHGCNQSGRSEKPSSSRSTSVSSKSRSTKDGFWKGKNQISLGNPLFAGISTQFVIAFRGQLVQGCSFICRRREKLKNWLNLNEEVFSKVFFIAWATCRSWKDALNTVYLYPPFVQIVNGFPKSSVRIIQQALASCFAVLEPHNPAIDFFYQVQNRPLMDFRL